MIDVHLPTTDGRELVLTRYTEPEPELRLLLQKLKLELPAQLPRESPPRRCRRPRCSADLQGPVPTNSNT
jgi:hypothetical protein